ncbi:MAG TPA: GWxTD domain-containing protein [Bacteroidota bacterium]|nr:GWxTD domain-containing protein [Bacteroidota bacterium]
MTLHLHRLLLFFALVPLCVVAQVRPELDPEFRQNLPLSYEAIPFYSIDTSVALVNLHYRISQRFFVFVKNPDDPERFLAKGELMVELRNSQDIAVAREIRQIRIIRQSQPQEKEQLPDVQGAFSFKVPEGEYTVIFSLDDRESGRSFLDRNKKVTTKKAELQLLELSYPMFALLQHVDAQEHKTQIIPFNRGTDVSFGGQGGFVYQLYLPDSHPLQVQWKIQRQRGPLMDWFPSFSGDSYTLMNGFLVLEKQEQEVLYSVQQNAPPGWKVLYVTLPIEKLEPGGYRLDIEISSGQVKSSKQYNFQVQWLNRPSSLMNVQLAIDALRHIATEEQLSKMQTGSMERNIKAFYEFWRTKDPDTTTAYNEVLVEYYRRVDEAVSRFSTLSGQDGYRTDRGRIFILYGTPTRIEKYLPPGEVPREVWIYERLKKKFTFIDRYKAGAFILVSVENL